MYARTPGFDDLAHQLIRKVQRQNQYFRSGKRLLDAAGCLKTIQVGHADVHDHDVGLQLLGDSHRFPARFGFRADFPPMMCA